MNAPSVSVERYEPGARHEWDEFIENSNRSPFILKRSYVEYHAHRFTDSSLMFRALDGDLVAVLPCCMSGEVIDSHGGLTYGGFVTIPSATHALIQVLIDSTVEYCVQQQLRLLRYRTRPWIYGHPQDQADLTVLHERGARLTRRQAMSVIFQEEGRPLSNRRMRATKKARRSGVSLTQSKDWDSYWQLLSQVLDDRHNARPVHTVREMVGLAEAFPESIRLYIATADDELVAGVVVYETHGVARLQYMASGDRGRSIGALDLLIAWLVSDVYLQMSYIDLGTSNDPATNRINKDLIAYKEGFGARTIPHDTYELAINV